MIFDSAQFLLMKRIMRWLIQLSAIVSFSSLIVFPVYGQCGLDVTFGANGKVSTPTNSGSIENIARQPDGKIVVVGLEVPCLSCSPAFMILRYNSDGSLDSTFGNGGRVITQFFGNNNPSFARALAIQSDGKIIVAGDTYVRRRFTPTDFDVVLIRYNLDGTIDTTFGSGGRVLTDLGGDDTPYDVALQSDGSIVVAGVSSDDFGGAKSFVSRYDQNGQLDASFGSFGTVITSFLGTYSDATSVVIQADGRIVTGGTTMVSDPAPILSNFALARYNADGTLDASFGDSGKVTTNFGDLGGIGSLDIQPDGKIVAVGSTETLSGVSPVNNDIALARYNADGTLDLSFGTGGKVKNDFGRNEAGRGTLQPDGKIVVAGQSIDHSYLNSDLFVARYNSDGSLDASFCGGHTTSDFGGNAESGFFPVLQDDGNILVGGSSGSNGPNSVLLARYLGNPDSNPPSSTTTLDGILGTNGWYVDDVIITLAASDQESGIQNLTYQINNSSPVIVTGSSAPVVITQEGQTTLTYFAKDNAGNVETPRTVTVRLDKTAPEIVCGATDGVWHSGNVNISCSASDAVSGLSAADLVFSLGTSLTDQTEASNAATSSRSVCDAAGKCKTAGPIGGNKIDKKVPTISLTAPNADVYLLNQSVPASYTCADGGSGVAACIGSVTSGTSINTSSVGVKNFSVNSTDNVGNSAATKSVDYTVTYDLRVLFDQTKAAKSGSTVPIKIQLIDALGRNVSSPTFTVHAVNLIQTSNSSLDVINDAGNSNPDNNFRFDSSLSGGGYIFNLKTTGLSTGTYLLGFIVDSDPTIHTVHFAVRQ